MKEGEKPPRACFPNCTLDKKGVCVIGGCGFDHPKEKK